MINALTIDHDGGRWRGVVQILRFNRAMYIAAAAGLVAGLLMLATVPLPIMLQAAMVTVLAGTVFFAFSALWVSHLVYDRALPTAWNALVALGPDRVQRWLQLHAGVDETRGALRRLLPDAEAVVLDIFDPQEMTEPSIRRAHALQMASPGCTADYRALPASTAAVDVVFLIFAAHELRTAEARGVLFRELARVLRPGGRIVLLEHCRSLANTIAFGPGVLHFFSRRAWLRAGNQPGLRWIRRGAVTRFADVLVWEKES